MNSQFSVTIMLGQTNWTPHRVHSDEVICYAAFHPALKALLQVEIIAKVKYWMICFLIQLRFDRHWSLQQFVCDVSAPNVSETQLVETTTYLVLDNCNYFYLQYFACEIEGIIRVLHNFLFFTIAFTFILRTNYILIHTIPNWIE